MSDTWYVVPIASTLGQGQRRANATATNLVVLVPRIHDEHEELSRVDLAEAVDLLPVRSTTR